MGKDKTKNEERRRRMFQRLRSFAGPALILAVIAAGILVVTFWKDEEEVPRIIDVSKYEGKEDSYVLENESLRLEMDAESTQFRLTVKDTGKVWYSNPQEAAKDPLALDAEKENLQSTLLLTYSTIDGVDTLYSNYTYSVKNKNYTVEQGEDYLKVNYSVGDVEKEYIIPPVISEENMDALLEKMENSDAVMVTDYYKKYDINDLGAKEDKDELLKNYPALETEVLYILRDTTKDNMKSKFEEFFRDAGYTEADYARDLELDQSVSVSDAPVFNVSMIYRLDGSDLLVEVPMEEIEYKEEYPLLYLNVLPYFGAGSDKEQGELLVPEGGGSLIDFNNGKTAQDSYYANMYGWDMAQDRDAVVNETNAYFNVFGIAKEDASFLCILEEGAPYASIQADISGRNNSYNYVNASYSITHREQYDVADKYNGKMFVYEEELPKDTILNRYRFVDSGDYTDMAGNYRDYLIERSGETPGEEEEEMSVVVELLGAADKVKQVAGIPVSKPLKLTDAEGAMEILGDLKENGVDNLSVRLSGWLNGGIRQSILNHVKPVKETGGGKGLKELSAFAQEQGISLYLDGITDYAQDSGITDGFLSFRDAAEFVSEERAELSEYSPITYGKVPDSDPYYLLKPEKRLQMADHLAEAAKEYGMGISFRNIGKDLSSDFDKDQPVSRQAVLDAQAGKLLELKDKATGIMTESGNDYAALCSDIVVDMDLEGAGYTIIDRTVPFYQMAIHGLTRYTGKALNLSGDYQEELLKSAEYGADLYFSFMQESAFVLQDTAYTGYFGAEYEKWSEKAVEICSDYCERLGETEGQQMTDHEYLTDEVTVTSYENGIRVYVNYGQEDYRLWNGTVVPARDFTVERTLL